MHIFKSSNRLTMKNLYAFLFLFLSGFSAIGQIIAIPDANFKARLLEADVSNTIASTTLYSMTPMKIDTNNNGEIEVSEARLVRRLEIDNSEISSLTGIEYFTKLRRLNCSNNALHSLNLNALSLLRQLDCSHNSLTSLNCNEINNTIEYLNCSYNNLTSFIVPNFFEFLDEGDQMMYADLSHNQLASISLDPIEQLSFLNLSHNSFTSLSFTHLEIYGGLNVSHNPLTSIDLDNLYLGIQHPDDLTGPLIIENTMLSQLYIPFEITFAYVNNNPNLVRLDIKNDELNFTTEPEYDENGEETGEYISYGIQIDNNPQLAIICCDAWEVGYYSGTVPSGVQVTESCSLRVPDKEMVSVTLHPNPTTGILNISVADDHQIVKSTIYNLLGQTIINFGNSETLDVTGLSKGPYLITVETNNGSQTQKFIKL